MAGDCNHAGGGDKGERGGVFRQWLNAVLVADPARGLTSRAG